MALQNMIDHIYEQEKQEIEDRKNQLRTQFTQHLVTLGHQLETDQEDKFYHLNENVNKKEQRLKSEQDYLFSKQLLGVDQNILEEFSLMIRSTLIQYIRSNITLYHAILTKWYQTITQLSTTQKIVSLHVHSHDREFFSSLISGDLEIIADDSIEVGFIAYYSENEFVDVSFKTLFNEQKNALLEQTMKQLKEKL